MKKKSEIIKLIFYIVLPIIMFIIYPPINNWCKEIAIETYDKGPSNLIIYGLIIINVLMVCFIVNMKMTEFKRIYIIITVIYVLILSIQYLIFMPLPESTFSIVEKAYYHIVKTIDIGYLWLGGYLYCLGRVVVDLIKNKNSQKQ